MINQKGFTVPFVVLLIFTALISFALGTEYKQSQNKPSTRVNNSECSKQLAEKEEEINLCIKDNAKTERVSKSTYTFKDLGIYSPLFEGKEVESREIKYKRQMIISKKLTLEQNKDHNPTSGVIVWEYSNIDSYLGSSSDPTYVIFGGYENYRERPTVIDPDPKNKDSYTNVKNLKMTWGYLNCPKAVCRLELNFFSKYTPNGHPVYVQLWVNNPLSNDENIIAQNKERLKRIAETVQDFSTYH